MLVRLGEMVSPHWHWAGTTVCFPSRVSSRHVLDSSCRRHRLSAHVAKRRTMQALMEHTMTVTVTVTVTVNVNVTELRIRLGH